VRTGFAHARELLRGRKKSIGKSRGSLHAGKKSESARGRHQREEIHSRDFLGVDRKKVGTVDKRAGLLGTKNNQKLREREKE